ncbi:MULTISPECIES: MFS transporter [Acidobacterium]|uniref:MFS transporter, anion:cation symporter (ACS) family n=1 Tax=Acidobacterium capsulatum (strain ATCC 51196 / DSM 11244 / BCRC 80197 / JCM 7670 / NBRC 15755 / NCIMB 13165 / 161) TaxID=240015 RepID=C1F2M4_ACIC5|nr:MULTISPECIES: MFS transporter [Acidobacterium]ACO31961.1 MFS transporter, anion:cation symporter (ACS) family [Acidobacterium capsulatum ATCC 51196]HCT61457.1 MFS transporter [Acidobacterium sp.]
MAAQGTKSDSFFRTLGSGNKTSHQRWVICTLLFFATVIAYVDRGVLAYLEKFLQSIIPGLNSVKYGYILSGFTVAYAIGMVVAGGLTDKLGTRKAFAIAIGLWSIAAMLPGAAFSVITLGIAMFLLGIGEAANFPACIKTVAEWFPKRERALATGIFNSGANIGNIVVPLIVPTLVALVTWRGAFVVTGGLGIVWLIIWLIYYRRPEHHRSVSEAELQLILSDPVEKLERVPWKQVLPCKETWAFSIGKFLTDPIWWFYLFWLPRYLQTTFGLSLSSNRLPLVIVYSISIVGSVGGGWISSLLLNSGRSLNVSRKTAMLICALCVVPVFAAPFIHNLWAVVALIGLATAAHQGWSANLFTLPSDVFPKSAVGSVIGIGGMSGAIGGALFQLATGYIVYFTHSYIPLFGIACAAYVLALVIIHSMTPELAPAQLKLNEGRTTA